MSCALRGVGLAGAASQMRSHCAHGVSWGTGLMVASPRRGDSSPESWALTVLAIRLIQGLHT
jgi:hypothetical protein